MAEVFLTSLGLAYSQWHRKGILGYRLGLLLSDAVSWAAAADQSFWLGVSISCQLDLELSDIFYPGVLCALSPEGFGCTIVSPWYFLMESVSLRAALSIVLAREATEWTVPIRWQGIWEAEQGGQYATDTGQPMFLLTSALLSQLEAHVQLLH